jgi:hypothetical protein
MKPPGCPTQRSHLRVARVGSRRPRNSYRSEKRCGQTTRTEFAALTTALDKRFNRPDADWMGVFRAAAEMALMAQVGTDLRPVDRTRLRELWDALLAQ